MNLPIPIPTVTPGAQYAFDEVSCFNAIDGHNHTSGNGVPVPTAGLNINAALTMNNYGLTNAQLINLYPQAAITTNGSVYRISDDLYYKDGAGNNVRITQSGSVAVSGAIGFTGLPSGTASASYNALSQSFIFESATNTPANIDGASITIRPLAASPQGITLNAPALLAASYSLELPAALPAATSALLLTSTGLVATSGTANSFSATTINSSVSNITSKASIKNNSGLLEFKNAADVVQFATITGSSSGLVFNLPDTADSYIFDIGGAGKINSNNNRTEIKGRTDGTTVSSGWIGETQEVIGSNAVSQDVATGNPLNFTSGPNLSLTPGLWLVIGVTNVKDYYGNAGQAYGRLITSASGTIFGFGGPLSWPPGIGAPITITGIISLTTNQTIYIRIIPAAGTAPEAGLTVANMPCGSLTAIRIG